MSSSDGCGGCQLRMELALNDFEHFLSADKGLSEITRECYVRHVLPFLTEVGGDTAGVVNLVVGPTSATYTPIMASAAVRKVSLTGSIK